jgi:hypothetical protein
VHGEIQIIIDENIEEADEFISNVNEPEQVNRYPEASLLKSVAK